MKTAVLYASVVDTDEDGIFVDYPFIGGIVNTTKEADKLVHAITNDKTIPSTAVITKQFTFQYSLGEIFDESNQYFRTKAVQMYDCEDIQKRRESSRKRK